MMTAIGLNWNVTGSWDRDSSEGSVNIISQLLVSRAREPPIAPRVWCAKTSKLVSVLTAFLWVSTKWA